MIASVMRNQRRKRSMAIILGVALSAVVTLTIAFAPVETRGVEPRTLQLLVVLDGLRPDYVIPRLMPRLNRLADDGVRFTKHHSVFPTVTRVNASSIATGAYPERHGLLGNAVFFPRVDPKAGLDTSNREHLLRIQQSETSLLDVPDLGSIFSAAGRTVLVASSGSTGSAYLLNHRAGSAGTKGGILHTEYTSPPELHARLVERLGAPPPAAEPDAGRNRWIVDALLEVGLDHFRPDVVILWLSDPDSTAHERGIGAPQSEDALQRVDAELGRLLDQLARRELRTNVFVTSDHGFSTHRAAPDIGSIFAKFRGTTADGDPDLVFAGQAVYDRTGSPERVRRLVEALQAQTGVGALFTAPASPGDLRGSVPGTLSFDAARWGHSRAGAILVSPDWSEGLRIGRGEGALLDPKLLRNIQMRSGVLSFLFMFLVQAGTFFVVPLFLSVALGLSAMETGVRLLPMSLTLLLFAAGVPKLAPDANPRRVVNAGFLLMFAGLVLLVSLLDIGAGPEVITGPLLLIGSGLGAMASQLGSVTVSAVPDEQSGEVGGVQNTGTQLGASIGTALAGAILISALTAAFFTGVQNNPAIPDNLVVNAQTQLATGVPFMSDKDLQKALDDAGVPKDTANAVVDENAQARIAGLRSALAVLALLSLLALLFTRGIPTVQPGAEAKANAPPIEAPVTA